MANNLRNKRFGKQRRGVAGVIAGVFFMAIILSTVAVYFVLTLTNERARASYQIQSEQENQAKSAEALSVVREEALNCNPGPDCFMTIHITNDGAPPLVVTNILLYCTDSGCPNPPVGDNNDPVEQLPIDPLTLEPIPLTLNAKEEQTRTVGPVDNFLTYRVDVITERGNIVSAVICLVDEVAQICIDAGASTGPDFELHASPSALIMAEGSSSDSTITVTSLNGFSSPVALSVSAPPDITTDLNPPPPVTPPDPGSASTDLTITTSQTIPEGTYILTVTGTSGALVHSAQISVSTVKLTGAVNEGIIQGTGSIQLDYKAFGSIYQTLGSRADVNQKGWLVTTASPYGSVTGYPAFEIMFAQQSGNSPPDVPITFVERVRYLEDYASTLTFARSSSVLTNIGKEISGQADVEFICNATKTFSNGAPTGGSLVAYNEVTAPTSIPAVPIDSASTVGWKEVYFCSDTPGQDGDIPANYYAPRNTFNSFHPLFMVVRGTFTPSHADYGQTIPYQSTLPGGSFARDFEACLRNSNSLTSACPGPNVVCDGTCATSTHQLVYSANHGAVTSGSVSVWVHLDSVTSPVTVSWVYADGTSAVLDMTNGQPAQDQTLVNGYVPFAVELPTNISSCSGDTPQYYTMKVTDQYDSNGLRNVYYMTFEVTCP